MAARVGNPHVQSPGVPSSGRADGVLNDMLTRWASDIMKQGAAAQEAHALELLDQLKDNLKKEGFKSDGKRSGPEQLRSMIGAFQKENGLPRTGHLDSKTLGAMKDANLLPTAPNAPVSQTNKGEAQGGESGSRLKVEAEVQHEVRAQRMAQEKDVKARVEAAGPQQQTQIDPERMLAQLLNAGFKGPGGSQGLEDALKKFQLAMGLPTTGNLDKPTIEQMKKQGLLHEDATTAKAVKEAPETKTVRRALQEQASTTATKAADKAVDKDPIRPQAAVKEAAKAADVAARADAADARPVPERVKQQESMRVDSSLAQQQANQRGVQQSTGDPLAAQGRSESKGEGAGLSGKGGAGGGAGEVAGAGSMKVDGEAGAETAVGNTKAGDASFADPKSGHASIGDDEEVWKEGHYKIGKLSEQIVLALDDIVRDDDGSAGVTYGWNVTLYEPGVYSPRQPAMPLWHARIEGAVAFDPRWTDAVNQISMLLLIHEPEANPPTSEDVLAVLRRARLLSGR